MPISALYNPRSLKGTRSETMMLATETIPPPPAPCIASRGSVRRGQITEERHTARCYEPTHTLRRAAKRTSEGKYCEPQQHRKSSAPDLANEIQRLRLHCDTSTDLRHPSRRREKNSSGESVAGGNPYEVVPMQIVGNDRERG